MTSGPSQAANLFLEDFIQKLTFASNDVNRYIRLIRFLDKRLDRLQKILFKQQKDFIQKISTLKDKDKKSVSQAVQTALKENSNFSQFTQKKLTPLATLPLPLQEIFHDYINILNMEKQSVGYARQKTAISSQLTSVVRQYFEMLQKQVKNKILKELKTDQSQITGLEDMPIQELINYMKKKKQMSTVFANNVQRRKEDFFYEAKQPKFCFCGQPSYGNMVFCQNLYCQREWFHLNCIKEVILPQKWFCAECVKMKDKTKNPISKSYF